MKATACRSYDGDPGTHHLIELTTLGQRIASSHERDGIATRPPSSPEEPGAKAEGRGEGVN